MRAVQKGRQVEVLIFPLAVNTLGQRSEYEKSQVCCRVVDRWARGRSHIRSRERVRDKERQIPGSVGCCLRYASPACISELPMLLRAEPVLDASQGRPKLGRMDAQANGWR